MCKGVFGRDREQRKTHKRGLSGGRGRKTQRRRAAKKEKRVEIVAQLQAFSFFLCGSASSCLAHLRVHVYELCVESSLA